MEIKESWIVKGGGCCAGGCYLLEFTSLVVVCGLDFGIERFKICLNLQS